MFQVEADNTTEVDDEIVDLWITEMTSGSESQFLLAQENLIS